MKNRNKEKGSILLLVMFVLALLAAAAISGASTQETVMDVARAERESSTNQMVAESAVEYAARRLASDSNYLGTGQSALIVGDAAVNITTAATPGSLDGNPFSVVAEAASGEGLARMQADLTVTPGVKTNAELALIFLGEEIEVDTTMILGDMLIADAPGSALYWVPDGQGGGSYLPTFEPLEEFSFTDSAVAGALYRYGDTPFGVATEEYQIQTPIKAPRFDLDQYLIPGPDRIIYWYENNLKNVSHEETAVFVLHPGHTLSLDDCHFPGGVVVWTDKGVDIRQGDENKVLLKHHTTIGGGTGGVHPYLGMIAPTCEIQFTHVGCVYQEDHNDIYGFMLWYEVEHLREARLKGQVVIYHELEHVSDSEIVYDPLVAHNLPPGIEFDLPVGSARIDQIRERYEP